MIKVHHSLKKHCPQCEGTGSILDAMLVGEYVRKKRNSAGASLRAISEKVGITPPYLNDLERGRRAWTRDRMKQCLDEISMFVSEKVLVYGLFDATGNCVYVGATINPKSRSGIHRCNHPELSFRPLSKCSGKNAAKVESQWIAKMKRNGMKLINKTDFEKHNTSWTK